MLRYHDLPSHTTEVLDLTSLTVDEFAALVPLFETAFLGYMADWTLHGRRRQARRYRPSWRNGEISGARAFTHYHTTTCDGSQQTND